MHSKNKGAIGEAKITTFFLEKGYNVFKEFGDLSRIDLIIEKQGKLKTIQVKTITSKRNVVELYSKKDGPNYSYSYEPEDVDIFAVYILDKDLIFFVASKELCSFKACMNFRLEKPKNNQTKKIRYVKDYTFERILRDYTPNTLTNNVEGDDIVQTTTNKCLANES
jgi:hypothetical protein